jgi:general secretion pathway protein D
MKLRTINHSIPVVTARVLCLVLGLLAGFGPRPAGAQVVIRSSRSSMPPGFPGGMPPAPPDSSAAPNSSGPAATGPWVPSEALGSGLNGTNHASGGTNAPEGIQLSFQGANIDMVVQWLAQTTGKTVLKHPQVQCQLTITSSKKVTEREAINLVYRALALEGYTAIELTSSIIIVPEGKEPMMSPELLDSSQTNVPEGRQRLVKVFTLKHVQAADLKDRIHTALSDKAIVEIDEVANQLIITDYNDNIRAVGVLINALDSEKPEDVTVRVIALKNVQAADLMKEIEPLYQKKNGKALKDTVEVNADAQANSLLVLSSEANFKTIEDFVSQLDTKDAQDKIMQTFSLKNADAQDVAKQLQDLNQDQGSSSSRYFYNFGSLNTGNSRKMTVVADRRRNAIIVQAPPAQMPGIEQMVAELDEAVNDDSLAPKIYPLKYVSATDLEDVLNELFLKKTQQRSYWDFFDDSDSEATPDRDVGRLYGKVRITSEPYSNALIVTSNSKENLAAVEEVIKQLDQPSEAGESTLHCNLKFAKAGTVANSINILFAKNGSPPLRGTGQTAQQNNQGNNNPSTSTQDTSSTTTSTQAGFDLPQTTKEDGYYPWLGGQPDPTQGGSSGRSTTARPVSDLVGRVRAVADERSNALLISANVHFFPQIMKLIEDLDAPTDQVLIEARLVEVSSDFMDKLGVRWSPDGSATFTAQDYDNSFLAAGNGTYQKGFGGSTIVNNTAAGSLANTLTPANLMASVRSGVVNNTISLDFLVQFLKETTKATVLAEPQLNIRDNETGRLFVGQEVPVPDNSLNSSVGTTTSTYKYKDVGIVLEVTPHINTAGDVELKIHVESSSLVSGETVNNGSVFDTDNFRTDLTAKNGQTLVLGGIIQKQISDTLRKTPLLGSIPGLKWLVNKKDKDDNEVELMVFLRPHVVACAADAADVLRDLEKRAPLVKQWQEDPAPKTK